VIRAGEEMPTMRRRDDHRGSPLRRARRATSTPRYRYRASILSPAVVMACTALVLSAGIFGSNASASASGAPSPATGPGLSAGARTTSTYSMATRVAGILYWSEDLKYNNCPGENCPNFTVAQAEWEIDTTLPIGTGDVISGFVNGSFKMKMTTPPPNGSVCAVTATGGEHVTGTAQSEENGDIAITVLPGLLEVEPGIPVTLRVTSNSCKNPVTDGHLIRKWIVLPADGGGPGLTSEYVGPLKKGVIRYAGKLGPKETSGIYNFSWVLEICGSATATPLHLCH